ncbi:MAG: FAD/NAD(P)-binding protein [Lautropia sp.]
MSRIGLAALAERARAECALLKYPEPEWVPRRTVGEAPVLDVLIVGAGQGGLSTAALLLRERVTNILVIDAAPRGAEGPWRSYARMKTLRSWKTVTGPDLGTPALTFQAWYEAQHGADGFDALGKIAKEDWHDYLLWLRDTLALPVRNGVTLLRVEPQDASADPLLRATVREGQAERVLLARKVVLAMGIERSGRWWMPPEVEALPGRWRAHTGDPIDFAALAGRRVAVLGAGASAFDNAATALEAGAADVRLFVRRAELQCVQPYKAISYAGFLRHFGSLDDATRWRFMNHLLTLREALPPETWERCTRHARFHLHLASPWQGVEVRDGAVAIDTPRGCFVADFLICGTGFEMDVAGRAELGAHARAVATWADRYSPPEDERNERLARYPYLGSGMQLQAREAGAAPHLRHVHLFDFGATMSFGPSGASINALKFAVPRLVHALTHDLFVADADAHYRSLLAYRTPEFAPVFARDRMR